MKNSKTVFGHYSNASFFAKFQKNKIREAQLKNLKGGIIIEEVVLA